MKRFMDKLPCKEAIEARCLDLGLCSGKPVTGEMSHVPITLQPLALPRASLHELYALQPLWNEAVDRTARNFALLAQLLRETAASDAYFTGRLLRILEDVYLQPTATSAQAVYQPFMLGIFRSDYMPSLLDEESVSGRQREQLCTTPPCAEGKGGHETRHITFKHVEINTISVSFGYLSPLVAAFHRYLRCYRAVQEPRFVPALGGVTAVQKNPPNNLRTHSTENEEEEDDAALDGEIAPSESAEKIPAALAAAVRAWQDYMHPLYAYMSVSCAADTSSARTKSGGVHIPVALLSLQPVVLVVTQEGERNTADQYGVLFRLLEHHGVQSIRRTLTELHSSLSLIPVPLAAPFSLSGATEMPPCAVLDRRWVVAVVYFRSTYVPSDFVSEACWDVRAALERSNAIKCPSVPHHLMTWKKMQQVMTDVPGVLTRVSFAGQGEKAARLAKHFVAQYSLNAAEYRAHVQPSGVRCCPSEEEVQRSGAHTADAACVVEEEESGLVCGGDPERYIREAIEHPDRYVLKPQLEGGGHLIAGAEMRRVLTESKPGDALYDRIRKEYVLMRRINAPKDSSVFLRNGQVEPMHQRVCSEVGIYGVILSSGRQMHDGERRGDGQDKDAKGSEDYLPSCSAAETRVDSDVRAPLRLFSHDFSCSAGYLVRTKPHDVEEGGVMAGASCLSSLLLV